MQNFADAHIHLRGGRFDEVRRLLDTVASKGVTHAALMALPYRSISENLSALYWKIHYKKMQMYAFGGVHSTDRYANVPYEIQAEQLLNLGFDGIKLIDMDPDLRKLRGYGVNDERYDKMFSLLEERGAPVVIHVANPETFWANGKDYVDGTYLSKQALYEETFEMLNKHPKLKVILAHFFFLSDFPEEAERVLTTYPNVKFDLTPGHEMFPNFSKRIDFWRDFFIKYSDRIVFGTDSNTHKNINAEIHDLVWLALTHDESLFKMPCYRNEMIRGLHLDEETVERICYKNFVDCVGEPKPVDEEKFYNACENMLAEMRKNPIDEIYNANMKVFPYLAQDPEQTVAINFLEGALSQRNKKEN